MSIAELYGKLSPDDQRSAYDTMEDLLTSDVFGTMLYAGWQSTFHSWLASAQCAPGLGTDSSIERFLPAADEITGVAYAFWPRLPNNREPDVAILIQCADQSSRLVVVEAKYHSGLSGETQLIDEAQGLFNLTLSELRDWDFRPSIRNVKTASLRRALLYVTKDGSLPLAELMPAPNTTWPVPVFWLSWKVLCRHLDANRAAKSGSLLLEDLRLLLRRKNLRDFEGFNQSSIGELPPAGFYADRRHTSLSPDHQQFPAVRKKLSIFEGFSQSPVGELSPAGFYADRQRKTGGR
jgi:hypothetical protein